MTEENKKDKLKKKLTNKYVLHISSEDSMEEKFSMRLNRLNVFVTLTISTIVLIVGTIILIAFTSLREYIPGYDSTNLRKKAQDMVFKVDSLENVMKMNQIYVDNIARILSGEIDSTYIDELINQTRDSVNISDGEIDFSISREDSIFRSEIEILDRYSIYDKKNSENFLLMAPIRGVITEGFNPSEKHFAIDMAVTNGTPILAVADGTIIFAEWTSSTGNVIIINHENNLISVYKHLADRTVEQGDFVTAGEVIATAGSTGEYSTGPHLHYELWYNGYPVNPMDYIEF